MSQAKPSAGRGRGEDLAAWLMGGPAFLGLFVFLLAPFLLAAVLSFTNQRLLSPNPTKFINLRNYDRLLALRVLTLDPLTDAESGAILHDDAGKIQYPYVRDILRAEERYDGFNQWFTVDAFGKRYVIAAKDPTFYRSLVNNFIFALVVVPLQSILALLLALLINQDIPGVNIFRTIYFSPVVTSMVVISVVWVFLYSQDGLINQFIDTISFGNLGPYNWLNDPQSAMVAIIIMSIWQGVGFQMIIFLAGLQSIPQALYEAASIDGAGTLRKFWNVTIPQLRNTIVFVAISTTILAFRLFTQVDVMTNGGPRNSTTTVVYHAVEQGFRRQNIGYGSSISVVFFLIVLGIALIQQRVMRSSEGT